MSKKSGRKARKGSDRRDLALLQAAAALRGIQSISELANAPQINLAEVITRAFDVLETINQLKAQNPKGLISADEAQALFQRPGDPVH